MKAVAAKFPSRNISSRKYSGVKQIHASRTPVISTSSIGSTFLQPKLICPCDGGCPVCQPKLTIGQPNDVYEQEADRVADEVMRMTEPQLQQQSEKRSLQTKPLAERITPFAQRQVEEEEDEEEELRTKPITSSIQRQIDEEEEEEEEELQTKQAGGGTARASSGLEEQIHFVRQGGSSLTGAARSFLEPRFGYDFGQVRVHTGAQAAELSRMLNAQAFTIGRDIVFGAGYYAPDTAEGRQLLAHELTHVVQQSKTLGSYSYLQRQVGFRAEFTQLPVLPNPAGARITSASDNARFAYRDANFSARSRIVATGTTEAELNQWDVGILQDLTQRWRRIYHARPDDGRGRFVERKINIVTRHRDQTRPAQSAGSTWYHTTMHRLLSGEPAVASDGGFRKTVEIATADHPGGRWQVSGSAVPTMDASDGNRNVNILRAGARYDTWVSAHNTVTDEWRHLLRLNWNCQHSLDFTGSGATLAVGPETWQFGSHGPYGPYRPGGMAPLIGTLPTANDVTGNMTNNRVDNWT